MLSDEFIQRIHSEFSECTPSELCLLLWTDLDSFSMCPHAQNPLSLSVVMSTQSSESTESQTNSSGKTEDVDPTECTDADGNQSGTSSGHESQHSISGTPKPMLIQSKSINLDLAGIIGCGGGMLYDVAH